MLFLITIFISSLFPVNIEYRYCERSDSFFFICFVFCVGKAILKKICEIDGSKLVVGQYISYHCH